MDTKTMTGLKKLDDLVRRNEPEKEVGFSDRCGLWSQHPQQGLVLELENGENVGVFYSWLCSPPVFVKTLGIRFRFSADGHDVQEVLIVGTDSEESVKELARIHRQLTLGHRQVLHVKAPIITEISIEPVEVEEDKQSETPNPPHHKGTQAVN